MSKYNVSAQGENCSCLYARKKLIHRVKLKYRICTNFMRVSTIFVKKNYLHYLCLLSTLDNTGILKKCL